MLNKRKNILTNSRIHFIAPDGYLGIVKASRMQEIAVGWMRTEVLLWGCYGLLTPGNAMLIDDSVAGMSLCSTVWHSLVYTNN